MGSLHLLLLRSGELKGPIPAHLHKCPGKQKEEVKQSLAPWSQSNCREQSCPWPNNDRTMQGGVTKHILLWFFTLGVLQSSETEALRVTELTWVGFSEGRWTGKGWMQCQSFKVHQTDGKMWEMMSCCRGGSERLERSQ